MGCCLSSPPHVDLDDVKTTGQTLHRPKWESEGMTRDQLEADRAEFWDTQPAYGGSEEIWSVLKASCEAPDIESAKVFLDAAEVKVAKSDMTQFYDSRGYLYELPAYVVSDPRDLK
eukprot:jgi/Ulvmu1/2985/UM015_0025.1